MVLVHATGKVLQHESGSTELNTFSGPREDPRHTGVTGNARRDGLMVSGWMDEKPTKISNKVLLKCVLLFQG